MGTEKFIAFKEDGTAYRLKGRILRFLDNEPVSEADKTNIRSTLSVPASAEGLTPANNLSDLDSAATARTNLSVNSKDEDAQANGTKTTAPSMYFNGSSSYVTVANDDKLTFSTLTEFGTTTETTLWSPEDNTPALTDGTGTLNQHYKIDADGTVAQGGSTLSIINGASVTAGQVVYYDGSVWRVKDCDDLPFTISGWVNMTDARYFTVAGKYGTTASAREWLFNTASNDKLRLSVVDTSGNETRIDYDTALTSYEGQWIHVAASYAGAGPSAASGNAFNSAGDGMSLYVSGVDVTASSTVNSSASYVGMSNTSQVVWIGKLASIVAKGSIRDVKIFNRTLTASEVAELARGNDLGFADEWAGALGGIYTQDATPSGEWVNINGTDSDEAGPINGRSNVIGFTVDNTLGSHYLRLTGLMTAGKRYRVSFDYNISAGNDVVDSIRVYYGSYLAGTYTPTAGTWNRLSAEFVAESADLRIYAATGTTTSIQDAGGDDIFYIDGLTLTEIGTLADFRSERYDTSTNKLYDISDNAFVGTGTSVTLTGREVPVYETGTWTPSLVGSGGSDFTYSAQEGYYTRNGDTVFIRGTVVVTGLGTSSGDISIAGFPFTASSDGNNSSVLSTYINNAAALTSQPIVLMGDGTATGFLFDIGTTGQTSISISNLTATTILRFSGTYQIQ